MTAEAASAVVPTAPADDFERVCWRLGGFDACLSPEWVDGYLAAVLAGPRAIGVDEWLPAMLGDTFARVFADPADERQARRALTQRWREIATQLDAELLLDEPVAIRLEPWLLQYDDADRADFVARGLGSAEQAERELRSGVAWARGFRRAIADFAGDWLVPDPAGDDGAAFHDALARIDALASAATEPESSAGAARTHDDRIDDACLAVQDLRRWWVEHAPKPTTRRAAPQPGRNDPCPCGSGRKYKRCHGA